VKARDAGKAMSTVHVKAPDVAVKEAGSDTEVLTAQLVVKAVGPVEGKGTVGQAAGYRIEVENKGTAELKNVVVRCAFPPDMRPTKATNGGQPFRDSVQWVFRELKTGEVKELNVGLVTSTPGPRTVQFTARADKGPEQKASVKTEFAGVASLDWDTDVPGTDSVGKTVTYRVTVANRGTAPAKNVEVWVDLPKEVDLVDTTPDSGRGTGQNAKMVMFPAYTIPAGKKMTLHVRVRARTAGEAKAIFTLRENGTEQSRHDKTTVITGTDNRSPAGPVPAKPGKPDLSTIGDRRRE
jgi:uncharacterized repeat protein (TIGR01451 family)